MVCMIHYKHIDKKVTLPNHVLITRNLLCGLNSLPGFIVTNINLESDYLICDFKMVSFK